MIHLSRPLQAALRLAAAIIAIISLTLSLSAFGADAWRIFPVWLFALAAGYFIITAALTILNLRAIPTSCPALESSLFISLMLSLLTILAGAPNFQLSLPVLLCGQILLPLLILFNYLLLSYRQRWSWSRPFKLLILPLLYFAIILTTSAILPATTPLLFPFNFLDIASFGILRMLLAFILLGIFGLIVGYLLQVASLLVASFCATRANLNSNSLHHRAK